MSLGRGAAFTAGAASGSLQRRLRKMSKHPEDPRTFSQAKILVSLGLPLSLVMTLVMYYPIRDYVGGREDDIYSVIVPGLATLTCYTLLLHGLFRRFGVDDDKVWTRFGRLFYREVRFDQIDRFDIGIDRYKLYAGRTKVNVDYNRFDYSLVFLRLAEQLQYRRFRLKDVDIDDPGWEDQAEIWRRIWVGGVYENHKAFYDSHAEERERLEALLQEPASYAN